MPRILTHIVEQHAEEAAFLWLLRDKAVDAPHYKRHHLARLDERVEAHVDGLRVSGEAGRKITWAQLKRHGEAAEMFAAAVTLVESGDLDRVAPCVDLAEQHPESLRGLVGAIAWTEPGRLGHLVRTWLDSERPLERLLGVAACSAHRADPHERLARLVEDKNPSVRAHAFRLVGELGRIDLTDQLAYAVDEGGDDGARFWSAWSLALLTVSPRAVAELQRFAGLSAPEAWMALDAALRRMPLDHARAWLRTLNADPERARLVVIGLGVVGDPVAVPWLIERMRDPLLARVAGESLSMITGVDLGDLALDGDAPNGSAADSNRESADTGVTPDLDDRLPWPAPDKVASWWAHACEGFSAGQRYLLGMQIEVARCELAWAEGNQRQRRAGALELARLQPRDGLRNWRAKIINAQGFAASVGSQQFVARHGS